MRGDWWSCPYTGMRAFLIYVAVPVMALAAATSVIIWLMFELLS